MPPAARELGEHPTAPNRSRADRRRDGLLEAGEDPGRRRPPQGRPVPPAAPPRAAAPARVVAPARAAAPSGAAARSAAPAAG
ncbi:MAG TPA: hypothetical protein VE823_08050, partial [Geodermatophilus sp.]|nr:hypothetical protein [Geodermatophilus sp.]